MDYAGIELISVIFLSIRALLCPTESPLLAIQTFVSPYIHTRSWGVGSQSAQNITWMGSSSGSRQPLLSKPRTSPYCSPGQLGRTYNDCHAHTSQRRANLVASVFGCVCFYDFHWCPPYSAVEQLTWSLSAAITSALVIADVDTSTNSWTASHC